MVDQLNQDIYIEFYLLKNTFRPTFSYFLRLKALFDLEQQRIKSSGEILNEGKGGG